MLLRKIIFTAVCIFLCSFFCYSQPAVKKITATNSPKSEEQTTKSSPAYAELLVRKTEREAELEELLIDYTDEFPKVKEIRFESGLLQKQVDKVLAVNPAAASKLTLALGKLMVRKIELEVDLWNLKIQYNDENPEVKRAKRKIEVYDKAIKEILP